jgi:ribonucleotide reductase beta subunit family protein with ferritin-like domain
METKNDIIRNNNNNNAAANSIGSSISGSNNNVNKDGNLVDIFAKDDRDTMAVIKYYDLWNFYKKLNSLHWVAQEIDMSQDFRDFKNKLTAGDRHYIKHILGFFGIGDEVVLENLDDNIIPKIKLKEVCYFYRSMAEQECIHSEGYGIQINTILSEEEQIEAKNAIRTMPVITETRKWITPWLQEDVAFEDRLIAFICWEGILFSDKFSGIQWYKERNVLPGLVKFNEYISRDEGIHVDFAIHLIKNRYVKAPFETTVHKLFKRAVELSHKFIDAAILKNDPPFGLNITLLKEYVCYNADILIESLSLEFKKIWNISSNPLKYMEKHAMNKVTKNDFFVSTGTQYQNLISPTALEWEIDDTNIELTK